MKIEERIIEMYKRIRPMLHLGCGPDIIDGADNVDMLPVSAKVIKQDCRKLDYIPSGKYSLIVAHQLLEHLTLKDGACALKEWRRVANEGCTMILSVPFVEGMIDTMNYKMGETMYAVNAWIYGKEDPGMEHKALYSIPLLELVLKAAKWEVMEIFENFPKRHTPSVMIIGRAV